MALVRLAQSDAGTTAELRVGDTVELTLPEIRTSGYRWSLRLPKGVRLVVDEFVLGGVDHPAGRSRGVGPPGQGGVRRLALDVVDAGRHLIEAELARPWEDEPRRSVTFALIASPNE
ncbi:protease inhibitor I42 family protein [Prauserella cavernicola]|uniref:Protease inhibitor I42 family protein n=1 Tax=Prauserella cavernicola TaxID=2800127 RepID=A0A934QRL4_9PSEU|nr:protease inhibitor I42 family protein [Prauserella cavernicola]MBK1784982.1 protease inhibitor I42 family protein [Prauserella cavernicola]